MQRIQDLYNSAVNDLKSFTQPLWSLWKPEVEPAFRMTLVTGDKRGAGTDANVYVIIHDASKKSSKVLRPQQSFKDDHERNSSTYFDFGTDAGVCPPFHSIEIWRDNFGAISFPFGINRFLYGEEDRDASSWFLDRVEISILPTPNKNHVSEPLSVNERCRLNHGSLGDSTQSWVFPVHRWIHAGPRYVIPLHDAVLPQYDDRVQVRLQELDCKRGTYVYAEKVKGGPVQTEFLPSDENFSEKFFWTFVEKKTALMVVSRFINWTSWNWSSLDDVEEVFKMCLKRPQSAEFWKEDWWFALQRLQGVNPTVIRVCEAVPDGIDVPERISALLDGKSLTDAVEAKRIFICNLAILEGINCKSDKKIAVPIAMFYLNRTDELLPILIQLQQEKSVDNPVFTPLDDPKVWLIAKMFYNNAEAQFHQSISHLGFTHLLMEGICAAIHRSLSPSHPIFRLLAPHFLYLIAINKRGEEKLVNPGGWVDSTMTQGTVGMFQLMAKHFQDWRFQKLNPVSEIRSRGVLSSSILPYYPYREDAVDLFAIIRRYVSTIVHRYYDSNLTLQSDWEMQNFRAELVSPFPSGLGLAGIPGTNLDGFSNLDEVVETISCIISTCTIGHAAANSQQYDQYAFVPNYAGILSRDPPKTKEELLGMDIVSLLPSKEVTLDIIVITSLLSSAITNPLGDFEVHYLYHPEDQEAAHTFRDELELLNLKIRERNKTRKLKYEDLLPALVPNSISI